MKSKVAIWASLIAGLLWVIVRLRDTLAPGFFTISGRVMSKLDIAMEFATAAIFLFVVASFHSSRRQMDGRKQR
jgi:hypothetical protein